MNKKEWKISIIIFLCLVLSFYFDKFIIQNISIMRNIYLDDLFLGLTFISSEIIIFFVLTSLFLWKEHKRKWIFPLWLTLFLSVVVSFLLKILIKRPRPFQLNLISLPDILSSASYSLWNFSFPSFQTMLVFSAIPLLSKEFPKIKGIWIIFASLVGLSRLYVGAHFLSDIISGAIIGYFIGILIIKLEKKEKIGEKIYNKIKKKK